MSTEYATWMADESVRNSLGELQHILDNAAGCIDELSGPKVMITDGPLEDGYVVSGVYSIEHGAKPETGLFFTSTQVENMRRAVTTLTKAALEQALTQQRGECYCQSCKGSGEVIGLHASPSGDPQDAYEAPMACPKCNGTGDAK